MLAVSNAILQGNFGPSSPISNGKHPGSRPEGNKASASSNHSHARARDACEKEPNSSQRQKIDEQPVATTSTLQFQTTRAHKVLVRFKYGPSNALCQVQVSSSPPPSHLLHSLMPLVETIKRSGGTCFPCFARSSTLLTICLLLTTRAFACCFVLSAIGN